MTTTKVVAKGICYISAFPSFATAATKMIPCPCCSSACLTQQNFSGLQSWKNQQAAE
jgi:hypothetical protein